LWGWWRFDDDAGSQVVVDSSGQGRDCQLHSFRPPAGWVAGVRGRALDFANVAWLECPFPDTEAGGALEITVAAWVERNSDHIPSAIATRQIGTGYHDQFFFGFGSDGLRVVSHAWQDRVFEPDPPELHRWFHAAFTHDRGGATKLYVDGKEVARTGGIPGETSEVRAPITFGAGRHNYQANKVNQRFNGAVDEVIVYQRALGAEEIAALAAGRLPRVP
jgi:hypothetical protein